MTLTLLGDLEVRDSKFVVAANDYRRASQLNPLDVGLQQLAQKTSERASPLQTPGEQPKQAQEILAGEARRRPVPAVERPLAREAFEHGLAAGGAELAGPVAIARKVAERRGQLPRPLGRHTTPA